MERNYLYYILSSESAPWVELPATSQKNENSKNRALRVVNSDEDTNKEIDETMESEPPNSKFKKKLKKLVLILLVTTTPTWRL